MPPKNIPEMPIPGAPAVICYANKQGGATCYPAPKKGGEKGQKKGSIKIKDKDDDDECDCK